MTVETLLRHPYSSIWNIFSSKTTRKLELKFTKFELSFFLQPYFSKRDQQNYGAQTRVRSNIQRPRLSVFTQEPKTGSHKMSHEKEGAKKYSGLRSLERILVRLFVKILVRIFVEFSQKTLSQKLLQNFFFGQILQDQRTSKSRVVTVVCSVPQLTRNKIWQGDSLQVLVDRIHCPCKDLQGISVFLARFCSTRKVKFTVWTRKIL